MTNTAHIVGAEWTVKKVARIKGKYVATVEIKFDFEESEQFLPFEEIKTKIEEKLTPFLRELIKDEVAEDIATVEVSQQFADCYRVIEDGDV